MEGGGEVVTEVPSSLKKLVRLTIRGFYSVEHVIVVDMLIRNPCVKEDDLADLLKLEKKQLRAVVAQLKSDRFVKVRLRMETGSDGKATRQNYYYINYKVFVNVVKYKLDHMRRKIETEERDSTSRASFRCTGCSKSFTDLEGGPPAGHGQRAVPLQLLLRARRRGPGEPCRGRTRVSCWPGSTIRYSRCTRFSASWTTCDWRLTCSSPSRRTFERGVAAEPPRRRTRQSDGAGPAGRAFQGRPLEWRRHPAPGFRAGCRHHRELGRGDSVGSFGAAARRRRRGWFTARSSTRRSRHLTYLKRWPQSSLKQDRGLTVPSWRHCWHMKSSLLPSRPRTRVTQKMVKLCPSQCRDVAQSGEEDDEEEEEETHVMVEGKPVPLQDVTEEMVARMTSAEKEDYIRLRQELYSMMYD
ncbi:hypothetical protein MRX96_011471 [Rhipicephalus microplus]